MEKHSEHLQALTEIRSMMERSSRFISLSGLSGIISGMFALWGAWLAYEKLMEFQTNYRTLTGDDLNGLMTFLLIDAVVVLVLSFAFGILLTVRNSRKRGIKTWDNTAKRLLINLAIPLASGGVFCGILLYHGIVGLVAPATLIFYGLALLNASKYTFNDIRYLGISEICLGLVASVYIGYGLYFWAFGFGILHILYGSVMYFKYERSN